MIARLQRALVFGLLIVATAWAWLLSSRGQVWWAVVGVAFLLSAHAVVLALEFVWMARCNRHDAAPRASPVQMVRAWWGEVLTAPVVFCWRQPFLSQRWPDHLPAALRGRRGIVLVHGFFCNRGLWNPWLQRLRAHDVPHVAVTLEPAFDSIDHYVPIIEAAVRQVELLTGRPPVIVAHSMGGLAVRRWWVEQNDRSRVARIVTIGSPHRGTWMARLSLTRNSAQMRLDSRWLQDLAARERQRYGPFTCFYGHCDNIAFPASMGTLVGADNRHLAAVAHVHMSAHGEVWAEVMRCLSASGPALEPGGRPT